MVRASWAILCFISTVVGIGGFWEDVRQWHKWLAMLTDAGINWWLVSFGLGGLAVAYWRPLYKWLKARKAVAAVPVSVATIDEKAEHLSERKEHGASVLVLAFSLRK